MTTQIMVEPKELVFIQSRAEIDFSTVDEYAQMMLDGVVFDPVEGVQGEDGTIWVWDGYHRGEAAKKANVTLSVNLRSGTKIEAEWLALTANQKHGLRRSRADKQRVVCQALLHPYGVNLSNSEIGRHCGVSDKTVARIRQEMEASSEIPKMDKRIVTRNGITYEQDITNIGSKSSRQEEVQPDESIPMANQTGPTSTYPSISEPPDTHYPDIRPDIEPVTGYEPTAQEFECPRCGQEKIVGVNGSRRWCLACDAEWPTAGAFLAEVNARQQQRPPDRRPSRAELQSRFLNILAWLEEEQLGKIAAWLDDLEHRLTEPEEQPVLHFEPPVHIN